MYMQMILIVIDWWNALARSWGEP